VVELTGRRMPLVDVPHAIARLQAAIAAWLPNPPLTPDQLLMLSRDNVVADGALGLRDLGISPKAMEAVVPGYLSRFRPGGRRVRLAAG
jgi:NADH dehydrogenase